MANKTIFKVTRVIARILEVLLWLGCALMVIMCVAVFANSDFRSSLLEKGISEGSLNIKGFDVSILASNGTLNLAAIVLIFVAAIIAMGFGAMICRNICRIFKAELPFCSDNIRLVKEIGIFAISIPVIQFVIGLIIGVIASGTMRVTVDFTNIFFGLVVLCLSQFFQYGAGLEKDVDGLL